MYTYVRNVSFLKNFTYVLNGGFSRFKDTKISIYHYTLSDLKENNNQCKLFPSRHLPAQS